MVLAFRFLPPRGRSMTGRIAVWQLVFVLCLAAPRLGSAQVPAETGVQSAPDFVKDVRPILAAACFDCHSAKEQKSNYRLDNREIAFAGGDFGEAAIVPSKSAESPLIKYVAGEDPSLLMPPAKSGKPALKPEQIAILTRWIDAGAHWPDEASVKVADRFDHWAYKPLERPGLALIDGQNPVDALLDAELKSRKLQPNPAAGRLALVRRLTYDLTGLPPTPAEIDAFLADCAQDEKAADAAQNSHLPPPRVAYQRLVERLLASPTYGEKWGQHWLDLARYGETHGYDKDQPRNNAWPYRDYVIRSFNEDKPYGRFVQEQLAGDVLFPDDPEGVLGVGFLAAGPWDLIGHIEVGEGKVDGRIAKHLDRDEMISAVYNVFLSTTVQCAQCHNHKFDPIKMEDYYRLHAVFAAVDRADRVYRGLSGEQAKLKLTLQEQVNRLRGEQNRLRTETTQKLSARTSGIDRRLDELKQKHGSPLQPQYGYHSNIEASQTVPKWVQVDLGTPRGVEQIRLIPAFDMFNDIGAGFGFPVRYKVEASLTEDFSKDVRLLRDSTQEDQPNPLDRELVIDVGGAAVRFFRITATKLAPRQNDFIFALGEFEAIGGENHNNIAVGSKVTALDSIEAPVRWGKSNLTDGIYHRELDNPAALAEMRELEAKKAAIAAELRDEKIETRLAELTSELDKLQPQLSALPAGELVYAAATHFNPAGGFIATQGKPRPIHLLKRGDIRSPAEQMQPGMPALWPGVNAEFPAPINPSAEYSPRAELALAVGSKENPLLWRSMANRVWLWTFGQGLSISPNDFGHMGAEPTHPDLLNWLACELRDDPRQSLKSLVRLLVTSDAYQRSSAANPDNVARDANNQYLWRTFRRRLTSQEIRDTLLAASGALRPERGGPSFRDFVVERPEHSPHYEYDLFDPANAAAHRRTIYRFVVRSQPQPFLTTLGCADPSLSVPESEEPTTALQALTMWNNRFTEAMSRKLAERLQQDATLTTSHRIDHACRLCWGRLPDERERKVLEDHWQKDGAASVARVLFNSNAFVYLD